MGQKLHPDPHNELFHPYLRSRASIYSTADSIMTKAHSTAAYPSPSAKYLNITTPLPVGVSYTSLSKSKNKLLFHLRLLSQVGQISLLSLSLGLSLSDLSFIAKGDLFAVKIEESFYQQSIKNCQNNAVLAFALLANKGPDGGRARGGWCSLDRKAEVESSKDPLTLASSCFPGRHLQGLTLENMEEKLSDKIFLYLSLDPRRSYLMPNHLRRF
ncbi:hypothetical protein LguiA_018498 [Lonicera macranthoides]